MDDVLQQAIGKLGDEFPHLPWNFRPDPAGGRNARISQWLGGEEEEVMVCAFVGRHIHEAFHRQDFFFLNFAYRGDYRALSARFDNEILVREGDCYIGQPYSGYALRGNSDRNLVIAGLLIRKDVFFNEYLAPCRRNRTCCAFSSSRRSTAFPTSSSTSRWRVRRPSGNCSN